MSNICVVWFPIITYCFKDARNYLTSALDVGTSVIPRTWLHDVTLTKIKTILSLLIWVKVSYKYKISVWRSIQVPKKKFLQTIFVFDATNLHRPLAFQISYIFEFFLVTYAMSEIQNKLISCTKIIHTLRFHFRREFLYLFLEGCNTWSL